MFVYSIHSNSPACFSLFSQPQVMPSLPPLIKIDQTIPGKPHPFDLCSTHQPCYYLCGDMARAVGYSVMLKQPVEPATSPHNRPDNHHDNSNSSSSNNVVSAVADQGEGVACW